MRHRLEQRLGGKRAISRMTIGTFHAICLKLLGDVRLISEGEAIEIAEEILQTQHRKESAKQLIQAVSLIKTEHHLKQPNYPRKYIFHIVLDYGIGCT